MLTWWPRAGGEEWTGFSNHRAGERSMAESGLSATMPSGRWAGFRQVLGLVGRVLNWLRQTAWWILPIAALLIVAALLKAYYVATNDPLIVTWRENRWIQLALVVYELLLALVLVSGWYAPIVRYLGLATFLVYFQVALYEALISGRPTCSCFGGLNLSPWWAVVADIAAVVLLDWWQAPYQGLSRRHWPRLVFVALLTVGTIGPVIHAILEYAPRGPVAELRKDQRLSGYVDLVKRNTTGKDVIEAVQQATGVPLSWDKRLPVATLDLGYFQVRKGRPWAMLESVARRMPEPVRWRQVGDGYYLAPASRFASKETFFWIGGVAVAASILLCSWPVVGWSGHKI